MLDILLASSVVTGVGTASVGGRMAKEVLGMSRYLTVILKDFDCETYWCEPHIDVLL